ncbi:uncharacterized protein LOC113146873 [Cyclospora cayetanensis]|uniref:Uncharacterized protein LOC113146873 n=1 Tax=Cyclospora cayetanensis TaxID=88456 RepID=A0A6P6RTZ9_9EIME|nr:uncharacterized protein LOC113146873 [Cyclospora cayetanensis]
MYGLACAAAKATATAAGPLRLSAAAAEASEGSRAASKCGVPTFVDSFGGAGCAAIGVAASVTSSGGGTAAHAAAAPDTARGVLHASGSSALPDLFRSWRHRGEATGVKGAHSALRLCPAAAVIAVGLNHASPGVTAALVRSASLASVCHAAAGSSAGFQSNQSWRVRASALCFLDQYLKQLATASYRQRQRGYAGTAMLDVAAEKPRGVSLATLLQRQLRLMYAEGDRASSLHEAPWHTRSCAGNTAAEEYEGSYPFRPRISAESQILAAAAAAVRPVAESAAAGNCNSVHLRLYYNGLEAKRKKQEQKTLLRRQQLLQQKAACSAPSSSSSGTSSGRLISQMLYEDALIRREKQQQQLTMLQEQQQRLSSSSKLTAASLRIFNQRLFKAIK